MKKASNTYPIRAVSLMTGVSIDTLRAWERRYGAVSARARQSRSRLFRRRRSPYRVAAQHRTERTRNWSGREHDHRAAGRALGCRFGECDARAHRRPIAASDRDLDSIIAALERFDAAAVKPNIGRAAAMLRPPELLRDVLVPVLTEVGERWHRGHARITPSTCSRPACGTCSGPSCACT